MEFQRFQFLKINNSGVLAHLLKSPGRMCPLYDRRLPFECLHVCWFELCATRSGLLHAGAVLGACRCGFGQNPRHHAQNRALGARRLGRAAHRCHHFHQQGRQRNARAHQRLVGPSGQRRGDWHLSCPGGAHLAPRRRVLGVKAAVLHFGQRRRAGHPQRRWRQRGCRYRTRLAVAHQLLEKQRA
jgi:hypothetical protein